MNDNRKVDKTAGKEEVELPVNRAEARRRFRQLPKEHKSRYNGTFGSTRKSPRAKKPRDDDESITG